MTTWINGADVLGEVSVIDIEGGDRVRAVGRHRRGKCRAVDEEEWHGTENGGAVHEDDVSGGRSRSGATGSTVAVNVTFAPDAAGLADEVNVVVVAARLTIWVRAADVPAAKLASSR